MQPLGLTLNNPANIRTSKDHWQGSDGSASGFVRFRTINYGVRALLCVLRTYVFHHGLHSIEEIISRFAPPSENDTERYIDVVSKMCTNYKREDEYLSAQDFRNPPSDNLYRLAFAICRMETSYYLTRDTFDNAFQMM